MSKLQWRIYENGTKSRNGRICNRQWSRSDWLWLAFKSVTANLQVFCIAEMPLTGASQRRYSTIKEECEEVPKNSSPSGLRGWTNAKIDWLFRRGAYPVASPRRTVHINAPEASASFCTNKINTAKYSLITFIPKFLLEQFKRYANLFFLFISLLQVSYALNAIAFDVYVEFLSANSRCITNWSF